MGPIQAIDCLSAMLATKSVLDDNGYRLNWGRGIAYGHSHGAYLAHLCNLFAPGLFSLLIDNSAWLIIYQGIHDNLVDHREKAAFARGTNDSRFYLITEANVDGQAFRSTGHGLNSDHLKLFHSAYDSSESEFPYQQGPELSKISFRTNEAEYSIDYAHGLPTFSRWGTS